jgi:hypothetical protein
MHGMNIEVILRNIHVKSNKTLGYYKGIPEKFSKKERKISRKDHVKETVGTGR